MHTVRNILTFLLLTFFCFNSVSQAQESWKSLYESKNYITNFFDYNPAKLNSDGSRLAFGYNGSYIAVLNTSNGSIIWKNYFKSSIAYNTEFSPDDSKLAVTCDSTLQILDAATGGIIWTKQNRGNLRYAVYSPDGKIIACGGKDSTLAIISADNGALIWSRKLTQMTWIAKFTPDGTKIVSADKNYIKVWDVKNNSLLWTAFCNDADRYSLDISSDGKKVAAEGYVWDLNTGKLLWSNSGLYLSFKFSPDGSKILASITTVINLYNADDGKLLWQGKMNQYVHTANFSPDGSKVVSGCELDSYSGNNIQMWNTYTGEGLWSGKVSDYVKQVIFLPDGNKFLSVDFDGNINMWQNERSLILSEQTNNFSKLECGTEQEISWISNNVSEVNLEYSTDNGLNWITIENSVPASAQKYTWEVPTTTSQYCKIRISDASNPQLKSQSKSTFIIDYITLSLLSPIGEEILYAGTTTNISWKYSLVDSVNIEYSTDNGDSWKSVTNPVRAYMGIYSWTVPNTPSSQCLVRVSATNKPSLIDTSNNTFTIKPQITVTSPTAGNVLKTGSYYNITWDCGNISYVKIEYSVDDGSTWMDVITPYEAYNGHYQWKVPPVTSSKCKIKISNTHDLTYFDVSEGNFEISQDLVLDTPNGGENWKAGTIQTIDWTSSFTQSIKIEYSTNNGSNWNLIVNSVAANVGKYYWNIPKIISIKCLIKITDTNNPLLYDISDNSFSMYYPVLSLLQPNGGEIWKPLTLQKIYWESSYIEKLAIELTTDNGKSWSNIVSNYDALQMSYLWRVTDVSSDSCKIRLIDEEDTEVTDSSSDVFKIIKPSISIISPNGGEQWLLNDFNTIKWESNLITNVRIDYTTNYGIQWWPVVSSVSANTGKYIWKAPDTKSVFCKIRISDAGNSSNYDESDSTFSITDVVKVTDEDKLPSEYRLLQNYPNPFNPTTTITFEIPRQTSLELTIYDVKGAMVRTLLNGEYHPGRYSINFDASSLTSGVYYYRLKYSDGIITKKMMLIK